MALAQRTLGKRTADQPESGGPWRAPESGRPRRLYELDILRFLAALAVVFFHLSYTSTGGAIFDRLDVVSRYGYLGVDVFFMISGFVIMMSARGSGVRRFAANRFIRLVPTYWLGILLTAAIASALGTSVSLSKVLINFTMLQTVVGSDHLDAAYWSLLYEVRFYALVAVVIRLGLLKKIEEILLGWSVISAVGMVLELPGLVRALLMTNYAHYFIAGMLFALIKEDRQIDLRRGLLVVLSACLASQYGAANATALQEGYGDEFSTLAVRIVIGLFFVLFAVISWTGIPQIKGKIFVTLGAMTYPLYLIHQLIGFSIFVRWGADPALMLGVVVVGMIAASHVIAKYFEAPLGRWARKAIPASW